MRTVLLENAEGQQTGSLRTVDAFAEVGGGEFFPVNRKLGRGLCVSKLRGRQGKGQKSKHQKTNIATGASCHGESTSGEILARKIPPLKRFPMRIDGQLKQKPAAERMVKCR
jgi:cytochrome c553